MGRPGSVGYKEALDTVISCVYEHVTIPIDVYNGSSTPMNTHYSFRQVSNRYLLYRTEDGHSGELPCIIILQMDKDANNRIYIFKFIWEPCANHPVNGSIWIEKLLCDRTKTNTNIIDAIQPFLEKSDPYNTSVDVKVCIPQPDGSTETLHVTETGLDVVKDPIRTLGGFHSNKAYNMVIAQDTEHTLRLLLGQGAFKLKLYKTEDIFDPPYSPRDTYAPDVPALVTISHHFHPMDQFVEETSNCQPHGVTGMIATAQLIMRRNVSAAPVRSMGLNRTTALYAEMKPCEITQVLHAMRLVTDDPHIATSLNKLRAKNSPVDKVVTLVSDSTLLCKALISSDPIRDIRLHKCGVLNYAIAHQNTSITCFLNRNVGLDIAEISTALYSGIAFCHACAYDAAPSITNKEGMRMNLINVSDFTEDRLSAVHACVVEDKLYLKTHPNLSVHGSFDYIPSWSLLRHNFRVLDGISEHMAPMEIECIAAASGLVYFRRKSDGPISTGTDLVAFIGAVYVPPMLSTTAKPKSLETVKPISLRMDPKTHALVPLVSQLAVQNASSRRVFLQNATDTLFHLNSICFNNPGTQFGKTNYHLMLRKTWLHTHLIRAAILCGGVNNPEYYEVFAHLSTLAVQSLDRVDYWASVPYV